MSDFKDLISNRINQPVNILKRHELLLGGIFLIPKDIADEKGKKSQLQMLLNRGGRVRLATKESNQHDEWLKALTEPLKAHPNVFQLSSDDNTTFGIYDFMDVTALTVINPISFELVMGENAQRRMVKPIFEKESYSENIKVIFDGNIFLGASEIANIYSEIPTHGQVCREFLCEIYNESGDFELEIVPHSPINNTLYLVEYEVTNENCLEYPNTLVEVVDDALVVYFFDKNIGLDAALKRLYRQLVRRMRDFYISKTLKNNIYKKWSSVIDSYTPIPDVADSLRKARFPRLLTTIGRRRDLRNLMSQVLLEVTDFEMYKLTAEKEIEIFLANILDGSVVHKIWVNHKEQNEAYDSTTLLRLLEFLEHELQSIEGVNAEVTGALVGVVVGAIITVLISIIF